MTACIDSSILQESPGDTSKSPLSYDDMPEKHNQLGINIERKGFNKNFLTNESFLESQKQKYFKWQQA